MKGFKINLIAEDEDLKEKIYRKLTELDSLDIKQELEAAGKYQADFEATLTNWDKGKVIIYTTSNQFRFKNSLIFDSIKKLNSSYIAFELSNQKNWEEIRSLLENTPELDKKVLTHPIMLAGNLTEGKERKVNQQDIDTLVNRYGIKYYEICVETGNNVKESIDCLYDQMRLAQS